MHYLQSVTASLALGGELAYQRGPGVPGGQVAVVSAAGRYTNGDSTISGSLGEQTRILGVCFAGKLLVTRGFSLRINRLPPVFSSKS